MTATDACLESGLEVPQLSATISERLQKMLPSVGGSATNPVDLSLASAVNPRIHGEALEVLIQEEALDMLLLISIVGGEPLCEMVSEAMSHMEIRKPLAVTVMAGTLESVMADFPMFLKKGIPVYTDAARAVKALSRLWGYAKFRESCLAEQKAAAAYRRGESQRWHTASIIGKALAEGRSSLSEHESKEVLRISGISVNMERLVHDRRGLKQNPNRDRVSCGDKGRCLAAKPQDREGSLSTSTSKMNRRPWRH